MSDGEAEIPFKDPSPAAEEEASKEESEEEEESGDEDEEVFVNPACVDWPD
jgi:hypothetical protein